MTTLWDIISENSATVANLATLLSLFGLLLIYKQLKQGERVNLGSNTIELVKYLQQQDIRAARYYCVDTLKGKPVAEYDAADRENAASVCSSYDLAGIFIRNGYASKSVIVDSWGPSIIETHDTLRAYIAQRRNLSGDRFWDDFDWLAQEAQSFGQS